MEELQPVPLNYSICQVAEIEAWNRGATTVADTKDPDAHKSLASTTIPILSWISGVW